MCLSPISIADSKCGYSGLYSVTLLLPARIRMIRRLYPLLAALLLAAGCTQEQPIQCDGDSFLITNVRIADGSGAPLADGAVRVAGTEITAVGDVAACEGEEIVDGRGQVLAPGFIDTHSHADSDIFEHPEALPVVSQGITTVVVGQDGGSPYPLSDFFERLAASPPVINVAAYAGHNTLRSVVMGDDFKREATSDEVLRMTELLKGELSDHVMEIVGLGMACEIAARDLEKNMAHMHAMRDRLYVGLKKRYGPVRVNGHPQQRLPNTLSISFEGLEANRILDAIGTTVAASAGAACHSDTVEVSAVLEAMKVPLQWAKGTLRLTNGRATTIAEIDKAVEVIGAAVKHLRNES